MFSSSPIKPIGKTGASSGLSMGVRGKSSVPSGERCRESPECCGGDGESGGAICEGDGGGDAELVAVVAGYDNGGGLEEGWWPHGFLRWGC